MSDQEISEAVDDVVDNMEHLIAQNAGRLGISMDEFADRVANELKARDYD